MPIPAAVAVPAVAGVAGQALNYFTGKGAQKAQQRATDQALNFEREREATRRREYEQEQADRRRQYEARERAVSPYRMGGYSVLAKYLGEDAVNEMLAEEPEPQMMGSPEEAYGQPNQFTLGALASRRPYGL